MWVPKWYFEAQERNVKDLERRVLSDGRTIVRR